MKPSQEHTIVLHPALVRWTHWIWAFAIIILIGSGWRIYNQEPLFAFFSFPNWMTIGGTFDDAERVHNDIGLAGALLWHFAAMWLLFFSVVVYITYGIVSGHFRRKFLPIHPQQVIADITDFLRGRLAHDLGTRNAVQKLLYTFALLAMIVMIWSGLVLWKPVQFEALGVPIGSYEGARYLHFFGMTGIVLFILVHVALTLMVPKVLPPMITGRTPAPVIAAEALGD